MSEQYTSEDLAHAVDCDRQVEAFEEREAIRVRGGARQHVLHAAFQAARVRFAGFDSFSLRDFAQMLMGDVQSVSHKPCDARGNDPYAIVAYDILGCLRDLGKVAEVLGTAARKSSRPWTIDSRWQIAEDWQLEPGT